MKWTLLVFIGPFLSIVGCIGFIDVDAKPKDDNQVADLGMEGNFACYRTASGEVGCFSPNHDTFPKMSASDLKSRSWYNIYSNKQFATDSFCAITVDRKISCFKASDWSSLNLLNDPLHPEIPTINQLAPLKKVVKSAGYDALLALNPKGELKGFYVGPIDINNAPLGSAFPSPMESLLSYDNKHLCGINTTNEFHCVDLNKIARVSFSAIKNARLLDSYSRCALLDNKKNVQCWELPKKDTLPAWKPNSRHKLTNISFDQHENICGFNDQNEIVCLATPNPYVPSVSNEDLAKLSFSHIEVASQVACGILKDKTLFCWSPLGPGYQNHRYPKDPPKRFQAL